MLLPFFVHKKGIGQTDPFFQQFYMFERRIAVISGKIISSWRGSHLQQLP